MPSVQIIPKLQKSVDLPQALQQAASFLELHYYDVPFMTVEQIAEGSHTSKATVVRLLQRLGYESFAELRDELRADLYQGSPAVRLHEVASHASRDVSSILDNYKNQERRNLSLTLDAINPDVVAALCETLITAKHVWVYGQRFSYGFAFNLGLFLSQLLPNVTTVSGTGGTGADTFAHTTPADHVLIVAHKRIGAEKGMLVDYLTSRGVSFSVLTDSPDHPKFKDAKHILRAFTDAVGVFNCYASTYLLIQAIASTLELTAPSASSRLTDAEIALQRFRSFQSAGREKLH